MNSQSLTEADVQARIARTATLSIRAWDDNCFLSDIKVLLTTGPTPVLCAAP